MNLRSHCEKCAARLGAICGALPEDAAAALNRISHVRRIPAGQTLHSGQFDPGWFGIIITGVVKLVKSRSDGRQQIVGLLFPTDFVGRLNPGGGDISAEATTNLELCCFSRTAFESLMSEHKSLEHVLLHRALDELDLSREWMFLLGRKSAREKVASLLYMIAERSKREQAHESAASNALEVHLPLSRSEMADCLGLTIETVSREFHYLRAQGALSTKGRRRISIPDLGVLRQYSECGRAS